MKQEQEQQNGKQKHIDALTSGIGKLTLEERRAIHNELGRALGLNQEPKEKKDRDKIDLGYPMVLTSPEE